MPSEPDPQTIRAARPGEYAALIQRLYDQHAMNGQTVGEPTPPAQIARAEGLIGFELPPLLKALYLEANGGWAYNFYPLFDPDAERNEIREGVIDRYLTYRSWDLEEDLDLVERDREGGRGVTRPPFLLPRTGDGSHGDLAVLCNKPGLPVRQLNEHDGIRNAHVADTLEPGWSAGWPAPPEPNS